MVENKDDWKIKGHCRRHKTNLHVLEFDLVTQFLIIDKTNQNNAIIGEIQSASLA